MGAYRRTRGASRAELEKNPWAYRCELDGCFFNVCAATEEQAEQLRWTHVCPRKGVDMTGRSIIEKAWDQLDAQVQHIYELAAEQAKTRTSGFPDTAAEMQPAIDVAKARARGKAEILALLMQSVEGFPSATPGVITASDISAEAMRRYAARQAGQAPATPGVRDV